MKKLLFTGVSLLMIFSLVLASCDTDTTEKTTIQDDSDDVVKITESEADTGTDMDDEEETMASPDTPKYGGTIYEALGWDISNWANGLEFC